MLANSVSGFSSLLEFSFSQAETESESDGLLLVLRLVSFDLVLANPGIQSDCCMSVISIIDVYSFLPCPVAMGFDMLPRNKIVADTQK